MCSEVVWKELACGGRAQGFPWFQSTPSSFRKGLAALDVRLTTFSTWDVWGYPTAGGTPRRTQLIMESVIRFPESANYLRAKPLRVLPVGKGRARSAPTAACDHPLLGAG